MKSQLRMCLIFGAISSFSFANPNSSCMNYPGAYICDHGKVKSINGFYGSVVLNHMDVSDIIKGNIGAMTIEDSKINQINVNIGSLVADRSIFSGSIEGNIGTILFNESTLKKIDACSPNLHLNHSTVESIKISSKEKKIKIHLNNQSIVKGGIAFSKNPGVVFIDQSSELKGQVVNGKIVKESGKKI